MKTSRSRNQAPHRRARLPRLGSNTELVVGHAPCPVLVVRGHEREFV